MTSIDFFYISLGGGFLILVACATAVTIQVWKILADVRSITDNAAGVAGDIASLKDGLKTAGVTLIQNLLEKTKPKGGVSKRNDKKEEE